MCGLCVREVCGGSGVDVFSLAPLCTCTGVAIPCFYTPLTADRALLCLRLPLWLACWLQMKREFAAAERIRLSSLGREEMLKEEANKLFQVRVPACLLRTRAFAATGTGFGLSVCACGAGPCGACLSYGASLLA